MALRRRAMSLGCTGTNWSVVMCSGIALGHTGMELGYVGMHWSGTGMH